MFFYKETHLTIIDGRPINSFSENKLASLLEDDSNNLTKNPYRSLLTNHGQGIKLIGFGHYSCCFTKGFSRYYMLSGQWPHRHDLVQPLRMRTFGLLTMRNVF